PGCSGPATCGGFLAECRTACGHLMVRCGRSMCFARCVKIICEADCSLRQPEWPARPPPCEGGEQVCNGTGGRSAVLQPQFLINTGLHSLNYEQTVKPRCQESLLLGQVTRT